MGNPGKPRKMLEHHGKPLKLLEYQGEINGTSRKVLRSRGEIQWVAKTRNMNAWEAQSQWSISRAVSTSAAQRSLPMTGQGCRSFRPAWGAGALRPTRGACRRRGFDASPGLPNPKTLTPQSHKTVKPKTQNPNTLNRKGSKTSTP